MGQEPELPDAIRDADQDHALLRQTLAACRARTGFTALAGIIVGGGGRLRGIGSFLTEQLGIPAWRLTPDDVGGLAGPKVAADLTAAAAVDSAAMTIGMAMATTATWPISTPALNASTAANHWRAGRSSTSSMPAKPKP